MNIRQWWRCWRWRRAPSSLPHAVHNEIARAYFRLARPIKANPINLLGYTISFMGEVQFRYLFDEIFLQGSYFFRPDNDRPLIVDCGSNIGMSVLFFKKLYPNARIMAFEPDPFTFETLRRNVEQNHLDDVELHQVALGGSEGQVEFYRDSSRESASLLMSTVRERHDGPSVMVPAGRLSRFITSEIDLLKIDVEGAEDAVVGELVKSGKLRNVKRIHLEYHHHIDGSADGLSNILALLEDNGFGYQLRVPAHQWPMEGLFQDISIYCYRK